MAKNKKRKNRNKRSTDLKPTPKSSNVNTLIIGAMAFVGAALLAAFSLSGAGEQPAPTDAPRD